MIYRDFIIKIENFLKNIKKNLFAYFLGALLVVGYFFTRLINLTIIPVFADEAIYIRWAQVMRAVSSLRFLPLSDGKQPLFMWLIIPFLKIINDPLVAGRLISVIAGFGTLAGIFILSQILFKKKEISFFAAILYLITPYTLFFDRMALADGLLSFFGVWILIFLILLIKKQRLDIAMIAGILLGLSLITKSPSLFFAILIPSTLLVFPFERGKWQKQMLKIIFLWAIVGIFGYAIYNILRLGPEFHMIAIRNKDYVFSFFEIIKHPLNPLIPNFKQAVSWFFILLTPLTFVTAILGGFLVLKKNFKEGLLIWLWILVPLLGECAVARVFTSRYILFIVPLFLIFSAYFISEIFTKLKSKLLTIIFLILVFVFPVYQTTLLLSSPQKAWLPANERSGYLELWTAGYGIKEVSEYIRNLAKSEKVLVGTEGYFGTLPDGLQIYLEKVPNITIIGVGQPVREISSKLKDGLKDNRVFLVVNDSRFLLSEKSSLNLIEKFPKAQNSKGKRENLLFFELLRK